MRGLVRGLAGASVLTLCLAATGCGATGSSPHPTSARLALGHASAGRLAVSQAWASTTPAMRAMPGMAAKAGTVAAYVVLRNTGSTGDRLVGVSSPEAASVQLHTTVSEGSGAEVMTRMAGLDLPGHATVRMRPGGDHLMLTGVRSQLRIGDRVPIVLRFRSGTLVRVEVPVIDPTDRPGDG